MRNRKPAIDVLRANGWTYDEIGEMFGISKQRVYQIETGKVTTGEAAKRAKRKYHRKHMLRVGGKMIRVNKRERSDDICEVCNKDIDWRLHYHHWNDEKPELGIWVCASCHKGCEFVDKGLASKYLGMKGLIDKCIAL